MNAQAARSRRLPTGRGIRSPGPYGLFRDWQRTPTQSSVTALRARDSKWMSGPAGTTSREALVRSEGILIYAMRALRSAPIGLVFFLLTLTYIDVGIPDGLSRSDPFGTSDGEYYLGRSRRDQVTRARPVDPLAGRPIISEPRENSRSRPPRWTRPAEIAHSPPEDAF
jgi:hypothetical protein